MPSIIPGFGYDIFISYRHKDNLPSLGLVGQANDGWVTEFVQNLKRELEATFKEDISIYFDENPHDGLRESHQVDKSLEGKLKCIILIPIISQTYCDPKSFAWQHEFSAFNKLASADQFGRHVKLSNGNVASRILPIKIHDLEEEDNLLLEEELDEILRAVEFIYKSHGVNRPLTPLDNPDKNQNKTLYRDQINKVAHSVKEIISALKNPEAASATDEATFIGLTSTNQAKRIRARETKASSSKKWLVAFAIVVLLVSGLFFYNQFKSGSRFTGEEKSIAVLPFENIGSEKKNEYISDGITQEIINNLSKIEDLHGVTGWTSARLYKGTTKSIKDIGEELGVASVLTGTIQKEGDQLRVVAELTDVNTQKRIWGDTYNRKWGDVLSLQAELSQVIATNLNTLLTQDEIRRIESKVTNNPAAYDDFLKGKNTFFVTSNKQSVLEKTTKETEEHFINAIQKDSSFALAWSMLGETYMQMGLNFDSVDRFRYYDKALTAAIRGISLDPELSETNMYMGDILKSITLNPFSAHPFLQRAIALNPSNADAFSLQAWLYMEMGDMEKAELSLTKGARLNPQSDLNTSAWLMYDFFSRETEKLKTFSADYSRGKIYEKSAKMYRYFLEGRYDSLAVAAKEHNLPQLMGVSYAKLGQTSMALKLIEKLKAKLEVNWFRSSAAGAFSNPHADIAVIYAWLNEKEKAMDHLEWAYRLRERSLLGIRYNILFDPLRSEQRFKDLVKRLGSE